VKRLSTVMKRLYTTIKLKIVIPKTEGVPIMLNPKMVASSTKRLIHQSRSGGASDVDVSVQCLISLGSISILQYVRDLQSHSAHVCHTHDCVLYSLRDQI
jgi:hypothetical protein